MSLNFAEIESSLGGLTVEDMIDMEEEIDIPYDRWELNSKELRSVISVVKQIVSKSPSDKVIQFKKTRFGLRVSTTDTLSYMYYDISISNVRKVLEGTFYVSYASIDSLMSMLPSQKTAIFLKDGTLHVQLMGGSFPLTHVSTGIFVPWESLSIGDKIGKVLTSGFQQTLRDMTPYISQAEQVQDRKLLIDQEGQRSFAFGMYKWSMIRTPIQFDGMPQLEIRYKDLQVIKSLLQSFSTDHTHFYKANGMEGTEIVAVQGLKYTYFFVKSVPSTSQLTRRLLDSLQETNYVFQVNGLHLQQVLKFAVQNQDILEELKVRVSGNHLFIELQTSNGIRSTFKVMGRAECDIPDMLIKVNKQILFIVLASVSRNSDFSTSCMVKISKDMSYIGFSSISDSLISCTGETV